MTERCELAFLTEVINSHAITYIMQNGVDALLPATHIELAIKLEGGVIL